MKPSKHWPLIHSFTIPHKNQQYDTAGNYGEDSKDSVWFEISQMEDWRYEALVFLHEIVEYILVKDRKIKIKDIDKFDMETVFKVDPDNSDDPGNSLSSPYYWEHKFATKIERMMCKELGIQWSKYDNSFKKLKWKPKN